MPQCLVSSRSLVAISPARFPAFQSRSKRNISVMATPAFEAWVKGDPEKNILGDCPFSHRALLTLEEKKANYDKHFIDFAKKPDWLFKLNPKGSVPVVKDIEEDKWLTDSGEFVDYLEDKIPEPKLGKSQSIPDVGSQLFPTFVKYLKSGKGEEKELKSKLQDEFGKLSSHLRAEGPFLCGEQISAADLALGPKLYHILTAAKHYKDFELPAEDKAVADYFNKLKSRQSWKNTFYSEDIVNAGWKSHLES